MKRQDDGKEPIRQRLQEKSPDSSSIDPETFQVGAISAESVDISSETAGRSGKTKKRNENHGSFHGGLVKQKDKNSQGNLQT